MGDTKGKGKGNTMVATQGEGDTTNKVGSGGAPGKGCGERERELY
jgi:hypothetical protein